MSQTIHVLESTPHNGFQSRFHEHFSFWGVALFCCTLLGSHLAGLGPDGLSAYDGVTTTVIGLLFCALYIVPVVYIELNLGHKCRTLFSTNVKPTLLKSIVVFVVVLVAFIVPPLTINTASQLQRTYEVLATQHSKVPFSCENAWNTLDCCTNLFENETWKERCKPALLEYVNAHDRSKSTLESLDTVGIVMVVFVLLLVFICSAFGPCWLSGSIVLIVIISTCCKIGLLVRALSLPGALQGLRYEMMPNFTYLARGDFYLAVITDFMVISFVGLGFWITVGSLFKQQRGIQDGLLIVSVVLCLLGNLILTRIIRGPLVAFVAHSLGISYPFNGPVRDMIPEILALSMQGGKIWGSVITFTDFLSFFSWLLLLFEVMNGAIVRSRNFAGKSIAILIYRPLISFLTIVFFAIFSLLLAFNVPIVNEWYKIYYLGFSVILLMVSVAVLWEIVTVLIFLSKSLQKSIFKMFIFLVTTSLALVALFVVCLNVLSVFSQSGNIASISWWKASVVMSTFLVVFVPLSIVATV